MCVCVCVYVCACVRACVRACVYVCVCVCGGGEGVGGKRADANNDTHDVLIFLSCRKLNQLASTASYLQLKTQVINDVYVNIMNTKSQ